MWKNTKRQALESKRLNDHSPLKIYLMLTHQPTIKTLVLSVAVLSAVIIPRAAFSQLSPQNGGWVTRNGNAFEMSAAHRDTIVLVNPVTDEEEIKIREIDAQPVKMNGIKIVRKADKAPYFTAPDKNIGSYLIKRIDRELAQLPDGTYVLQLNNVIIDEKGRVVYFDYGGLKPADSKGAQSIDEILQNNIRTKVQELMSKAPAYIPAALNGQNVPAYAGEYANELFAVKDHKVQQN
jgi:hypothetical protein